MAITLLIGFAAVNTGNNLLFFIVSALLGFMAVSGVLGWLNIHGLDAVLTPPDELYSGVSTLFTLRLTNRKRLLPSFLLQVHCDGATADFKLVDRQGMAISSLTTAFAGRGLHTVEVVTVCSPFPINFFVRCRTLPLDLRTMVFPAPLGCPGAADSRSHGRSGSLSARGKGHEGDVDRIVAYSGGDPLKMIHWRLSARHGELKVKELSATAREPLVIDIDRLPARNLEEKLSCATYLVNRLMREGRPVGPKLRKRLLKPADSRGHRLRLLTELAMYGKD